MNLPVNACYSIGFERVQVASDIYFVPAYARHRPACRALLGGQLFEPKTHALIGLLLSARPGSLVHAGAFYGDMLPSFSRKCGGTVYAFEPLLENYVLSKLCVSENNLENVALFNAGLSDAIGPAKIEFMEPNGLHKGGGSRIAAQGQSTALVTVDSLHIADLSVIQLDVEGHELAALRGATQSIERSRPIILIEDNSGNCGQWLEQRNYVNNGAIPGQHVWSPAGDARFVTDALSVLALNAED